MPDIVDADTAPGRAAAHPSATARRSRPASADVASQPPAAPPAPDAAAGTIVAHGVSTFGDLALPADFPHLRYVNPDAPKGGEISIWSQGNFDSFNQYARDGSPAALSWLGGVRGQRVAALGTEAFGQTGDLFDQYRLHRLDAEAEVAGAAMAQDADPPGIGREQAADPGLDLKALVAK